MQNAVLDFSSLLFGAMSGALIGALICGLILVRKLSAQRAGTQLLIQERDQLKDAVQRSTQDADSLRSRNGELERARSTLEERVRGREEELTRRESILEDLRAQLPESFKAMGLKTLEQSTEHFIAVATKALAPLMVENKGDLEKREKAIEGLVKPVVDQLELQRKAIQELETRREGAYRGLDQRVASLIESQKDLGRETGRLVKALRKPGVRGRWGELQLRNVVESAGMAERCDFEEQVSVETDSGISRPDMIVKLPGGGLIVVDSKVALDAYLDATEDEGDVEPHLQRHAVQVESHAKALSKKEYWKQFERTPKLVIMFMPIESALTAALRVRPDLLERAIENRILIATPTTLLGLLLAVAHGWKEEAIAENARAIGEAGKELHSRLTTVLDHFRRIGKHLGQTVSAYNKTVGSVSTRVLPSARRLEELGASKEADIECPTEVDEVVRESRLPTVEGVSEADDEERGAA